MGFQYMSRSGNIKYVRYEYFFLIAMTDRIGDLHEGLLWLQCTQKPTAQCSAVFMRYVVCT